MCTVDKLNTEKCSGVDLYSDRLPTPIIFGEFSPPTKGGVIPITGRFLMLNLIPFYTLYPPRTNIKILDDFFSSTYDPSNLHLDFVSGCGSKSFIWENGEFYNFSYANPIISNVHISQSELKIDGSNFCSNSSSVNIIINSDSINNDNIISHDHETIQVKFNYIGPYSTVLILNVISGGSKSNDYLILYRPIPISINSVPSNKGGLITITGERLTSGSIINNNVTITIGNYSCTDVISSINKITCHLGVGIGSDLNVKVEINGVSNLNQLIFNFNSPMIETYFIIGDILVLYGYCLGSNISTMVYLDDQRSDLKINVDFNETILSVYLPSPRTKKVKVSVGSYGVESIPIFIEMIRINPPPKTNSSFSNLTVFNINEKNYGETPKIIIGSNISTAINNTKINRVQRGTGEYGFYFPEGCGENKIDVIIGNQNWTSTFSYGAPIITNCFLNTTINFINCSGDFNNLNYYNMTIVKFSNQLITPTNISNKEVLFPLESNFRTNVLQIQVCGIESLKSNMVDIEPTIVSASDELLDVDGGVVNLIGKNFNENSNISIRCNSNSIFKCNYNDYWLFSCIIQIPGPKELNCSIYKNEKKIISKLFRYKPPSINRVGGKKELIIIYGSNFYPSCSVTIENRRCFITNTTHSIIFCQPAASNEEMLEGGCYNLTLIVDGFNSFSFIFNYSDITNYQNDSENKSLPATPNFNGNNTIIKEIEKIIKAPLTNGQKLGISAGVIGFMGIVVMVFFLNKKIKKMYRVWKEKYEKRKIKRNEEVVPNSQIDIELENSLQIHRTNSNGSRLKNESTQEQLNNAPYY